MTREELEEICQDGDGMADVYLTGIDDDGNVWRFNPAMIVNYWPTIKAYTMCDWSLPAGLKNHDIVYFSDLSSVSITKGDHDHIREKHLAKTTTLSVTFATSQESKTETAKMPRK